MLVACGAWCIGFSMLNLPTRLYVGVAEQGSDTGEIKGNDQQDETVDANKDVNLLL
jgi:hypothetical protein